MAKLEVYAGNGIIEKHSTVARRIKRILRRRLRNFHTVLQQEPPVKVIYLAATCCPERNVVNSGRMLPGIKLLARLSRLNPNIAVKKWETGHVICGAIADIKHPKALVTKPPEHLIEKCDRFIV